VVNQQTDLDRLASVVARRLATAVSAGDSVPRVSSEKLIDKLARKVIRHLDELLNRAFVSDGSVQPVADDNVSDNQPNQETPATITKELLLTPDLEELAQRILSGNEAYPRVSLPIVKIQI
jgi:hypothetical protein